MTERTWHKGSPPHVGWWNASAFKDKDAWRWWDGERWSIPANSSYSARVAALQARTPVPIVLGLQICWTNYYPDNARTLRTSPELAHFLEQQALQLEQVMLAPLSEPQRHTAITERLRPERVTHSLLSSKGWAARVVSAALVVLLILFLART